MFPASTPDDLADEIMSVPAHRFWYGSEILGRAQACAHPVVTAALALRHQGLGNKSAGSAHVIRQAIQRIDGDMLPTMWAMFDTAGTDPVAVPDAPSHDQFWAATNIIGEVGGSPALYEIARRIGAGDASPGIARVIAHLVLRYLDIAGSRAPELSTYDRSTRETRIEVVGPEEPWGDVYSRVMADRRAADQWFSLVSPTALETIRQFVGRSDPEIINAFFRNCNGIPASSDSGILEYQHKQMLEAEGSGSRCRVWVEENMPRRSTFRDKDNLLQALQVLQRPTFWRDLVIARRRTWTDADNAPDFWVEKRVQRGEWTLELELAYPGEHYPYRAYVCVPPSDTLHGVTTENLIRYAEEILMLKLAPQERVRNIWAVDYAGADSESDWWKFGFDPAAFFEDIEWGIENLHDLAEQLEAVKHNAQLRRKL